MTRPTEAHAGLVAFYFPLFLEALAAQQYSADAGDWDARVLEGGGARDAVVFTRRRASQGRSATSYLYWDYRTLASESVRDERGRWVEVPRWHLYDGGTSAWRISPTLFLDVTGWTEERMRNEVYQLDMNLAH